MGRVMEERGAVARLQVGNLAGLATLDRQHYMPAVKSVIEWTFA